MKRLIVLVVGVIAGSAPQASASWFSYSEALRLEAEKNRIAQYQAYLDWHRQYGGFNPSMGWVVPNNAFLKNVPPPPPPGAYGLSYGWPPTPMGVPQWGWFGPISPTYGPPPYQLMGN